MEEGFLSDILAHPGDDSPRLIYADWLEEYGDEADLARAEFIRVQIELAALEKTDPHVEGPRFWALQARQAELLRAHQPSWTMASGAPARGEEYHRGFIDTVTLTPEDFLERAGELFGQVPLEYLRMSAPVRLFNRNTRSPRDPRLVISDLEQSVATLMRSPHLTRLRGLRLDMQLSPEALRSVARCPHLTNLIELRMSCPELTESEVRVLTAAPWAVGLRRLSISAQTVAGGAIRALAESANLCGLESLTLRWSPPVDLGELQALGSSPHLAGLRELNLWNNQLRPEGVQALAGPVLEQLEVLKLGGNWFGDEGAIALARLAVPHLVRLDLSGNQIRVAGVEALAQAPLLANVRHLDLRGNITLSDGLTALAGSRFTSRLNTLLLHFNGIGDAGVQALARSKSLTELVWVELIANRVTSSGARGLAQSPYLGQLARLQLERNDIDEVAQEALRERFGAGVSV
jgi:uncharacterized protein (TIGR02996 family)